MEVTKVYTSSFTFNLNAGFGGVSIFQISSANRELQLKSILWDWTMRNNTTNALLSYENNGLQKISIQVGDAGRQIALPFQYISGTALVQNGEYLRINKPGQYFFDSFFIKNSIQFALSVQNDDAANSFLHSGCIVVETSEKIIY